MPELPEVETRVRELRTPCVGRTIVRAAVRWPRHIATSSAAHFRNRIRGQSIDGMERRGKYLVFKLSADYLLVHLRMSGDLRVVDLPEPLGKHDHTTFEFDNGTELRFSDARKFGRVYLANHPEDILGHLGPEPLAAGFASSEFAARVLARKRQIKPLLLDQTFLAGVGNIYADESLHRAGVHPERTSNTLTVVQARGLWRSVRRVLREGIRRNGASIDWVYRGGRQQNHFRVYGRADEPCLKCGTPIQRIVVGQRSTYFCPHCQPASRVGIGDD